MKTLKSLAGIASICISLHTTVLAQNSPNRIAFILKNNLGYHRMFRVEGPGIAYGFTMNRKEKTPENWPVGSRLYFSRDGETNGRHILTIKAEDAGKTVLIDVDEPRVKSLPRTTKADKQELTVRFRNNSFGFRKVALITYKPDETGNGTSIITMAPYGVITRKYPIGTKVYFADNQQVDIVMSGKRLDDKPFLVIDKDVADETFDIFD